MGTSTSLCTDPGYKPDPGLKLNLTSALPLEQSWLPVELSGGWEFRGCRGTPGLFPAWGMGCGQGLATEGLTPQRSGGDVGTATLAQPRWPLFRTIAVAKGRTQLCPSESEIMACHQRSSCSVGSLTYAIMLCLFSSTITRMPGITDSIIIQLDPKSEWSSLCCSFNKDGIKKNYIFLI